jgi:hypothetical protein
MPVITSDPGTARRNILPPTPNGSQGTGRLSIRLTDAEKDVRKLLIRVANGSIRLRRRGLIACKELWQCPDLRVKPWSGSYGWGRKHQTFLRLLKKISEFELQHSRPPLGELVVNQRTGEPVQSCLAIQGNPADSLTHRVSYRSCRDAHDACWRHWGRRQTELQAEEGYQQDRTTKFRSRNSGLISACRQRDDNTCQACGFRISVGGIFMIDVHHQHPLGLTDKPKVTSLQELVCLCPTCHRIAHTRKLPLTLEEIRHVRKT